MPSFRVNSNPTPIPDRINLLPTEILLGTTPDTGTGGSDWLKPRSKLEADALRLRLFMAQTSYGVGRIASIICRPARRSVLRSLIEITLAHTGTSTVTANWFTRHAVSAAKARAFSSSPCLCDGSSEDMGPVFDVLTPVFIQLPGVQKPQFLLAKGQYMGEVIDAIITKFRLDFSPQQLVIFKLDGTSSRTMLDFTKTLNDEGVHAGTKLVVELAAAQAFAVSSDVAVSFVNRTFTVNGAISPDSAHFHYFLSPDLSKLEQHVVDRNFFMLYGNRGAGKTTAALHLLLSAASKYNVRPLKLDFNSIDFGTNKAAFWRSVFRKLRSEAERHNIVVSPFDDVAGFVDAFTLKSLGGARVLLMLDEFDSLDHAADGIKEQFLGAVRTIKQDLCSYGVQCIFAVGPFSVVFMRGESGSPFNVREAVPVHFFTEGEVSELLGQFASARGISLEAGVAADIHELTAGHAGLVCACGGVLDSGIGLQQGGRVSLAAWQDFRVRSIIDSVVQWPTIGNMADSVSRMIPSARKLLVEALLAGSATLQLSSASTEVSEAARYLASEGWLVAAGAIGTDCFRLTSPLVRSLAMRQLAKDRRRELTASLPFADNGQLDVPTALSTALTCFRPVAMRSVSAFSTKISLAPAVFATPDDKRVPSEAVYHYELFSVFRQWLGFWQHAQIYPEADVAEIGSKRYADLLIGPSGSGPRHILELVASSGAADVREHYSRTIKYMVSHGTDRGACITFTAVAFASDTSVPAARLEWPAKSQLDTGLVAVHVVHDLGWTAAQVYWKSAAGKGASKVDLTVKQ